MKLDVVKNRIVFTLNKYAELERQKQEIEQQLISLEEDLESSMSEEEVEDFLNNIPRRENGK